jgi:DNA-directed RNA polymerase III subunit RPC6
MDPLAISTKSISLERKSAPSTMLRKRKGIANASVGDASSQTLDVWSEIVDSKPRKIMRKTAIAPGASRSGFARRDGISIQDPDPITSSSATQPPLFDPLSASSHSSINDRFLNLFSIPEYRNGISNSVLKDFFDDADYVALAPIINELIGQSRLTMSRIGTYNSNSTELFYQLVSDAVAQQFHGLDVSARMVYQVIERAGNMGIWTKDIRIQTNIQQQALNKIFKALESRQLIKPVKSVVAKSKKLYMLYNLTPSKELTGGVWYSDLEFDHEFISELRSFILQCVRRLNNGKGVTLREILEKMVQAKISRVELSHVEVSQLVDTLIYDYMVHEIGTSDVDHEPLYVAARRVTPLCEFSWWDALDSDFAYRTIRFEDGVVLPAQEEHHHS